MPWEIKPESVHLDAAGVESKKDGDGEGHSEDMKVTGEEATGGGRRKTKSRR